MKTFRTVLATLSAVLLFYALFAFISVKNQAAFVQRTIYQGFDQSFVVALVLGVAFLLIAVIFTVAIATTREEQEEEEDELPPLRPAKRRSVTPSLLQEEEEENRQEDISAFIKPVSREPKADTLSQGRGGERTVHCIYCGKAVRQRDSRCPHCSRQL